jgi:hypothetical protein
MKNYFFALVLTLGLMLTQSASAAMLSLDNITPGSESIPTISGKTFSVESNGPSMYNLTISDLGPSGLANLTLDLCMHLTGPIGFNVAFSAPSFKNLVEGTYLLAFAPSQPKSDISFEFTLGTTGISQVPVPAAAWLFGSALMGLMGFTTRKQKPMLAA